MLPLFAEVTDSLPIWFRIVALLLSGATISAITVAVIKNRESKSRVKIKEEQAAAENEAASTALQQSQETVAIRELRRLINEDRGVIARTEAKVDAKEKENRELRVEFDRKFETIQKEHGECQRKLASLQTEVEYLKRKEAARDSKHG